MAIWEFSHYDRDELQEILEAAEVLEGYDLVNDEMLRELREHVRKKEEEAY